MIPIIMLGFVSGLAASLSGWGYAQIQWRQSAYKREKERERNQFEEFSTEVGK
jgi:hypothetical protein